jgi:hypothetical protein
VLGVNKQQVEFILLRMHCCATEDTIGIIDRNQVSVGWRVLGHNLLPIPGGKHRLASKWSEVCASLGSDRVERSADLLSMCCNGTSKW